MASRRREPSWGVGLPQYNLYPTADGWVAVAALEPHFKKKLEALLQVSTAEEYRRAFAGQTSAHWQAWGEAHDVPVETVRSTLG